MRRGWLLGLGRRWASAVRWVGAGVVVAALAWAAATDARAESGAASAQFFVRATVSPTCQVSVTPLDFGTYDGSQKDATTTIQVTCPPDTPYTVKLMLPPAGTRQMQRPAAPAFLTYELYTDSARTQVWGDGTGSTAVKQDVGTGSPQNHTVYGRIFGGQTAPGGSYQALVTVLVEF